MSCDHLAAHAIATLGAGLTPEARAHLQAIYDQPAVLKPDEERDTLARAGKALVLRLRASGASVPDHLDLDDPRSRAAVRFGRLSLALTDAEQAPRPVAARATSLTAWTADAVRDAGFAVEQAGNSSVAYHGEYLRLGIAPGSPGYTASRITETPPGQPRPWRPTPTHNVVSSFTVRWLQPRAEAGMTHNLILWNASKHRVTAFGVSRALGGAYQAVAVQDFDSTAFSGAQFALKPMPPWLDATRWHDVDLRLGVDRVRITVRQGGQEEVLLDVPLSKPPEELGFEFSVDNETSPEVFAPVTLPDHVDLAAYTIGLHAVA